MRTASVPALARMVGCLLMLAALTVRAQVVDRRPGEMADDFAKRSPRKKAKAAAKKK